VVKQNSRHTLLGVEEYLTNVFIQSLRVPTNTNEDWYKSISTLGTNQIKTTPYYSANEAWVNVKLTFKTPILSKDTYTNNFFSFQLIKMTPQEISEMHIHSMGTSWDAFPARDTTLDDINFKRVEKYIREANATGRRKIEDSPADVLKKLDLIKDGKATWAAVLTFSKEPQRLLSQSAAHCGRFRLDKTQIIDDLMVEADLIGQVDEVMKFVTRHISVRYEFEGKPSRKEVWEYPLEALREAIINAIVHRDYTAPSNVQVEIYDDRIEIWNPGRLLPGITIDDLYKKDHKSVVRNKLITQVFYDIGYIEKYGSGTIKIVDLCRRHGLPSPEFKEVFGGFSVVFRKDIYTEEYLRNLGLNERQIMAVMYVKEKGKITNKEYREITGLSDEGARININELIEKGVLLSKGRGRSIHYVLK